VIAGKYFLGSKIESGAFADLYLGILIKGKIYRQKKFVPLN